MRMIAVDDEPLVLDGFCKLLRKVEPEAEIVGFIKPSEAFVYLTQNKADIAFLDIEMGSENGIALAKRCKELCPTINIIFVTGYSQYMMDAFKLHVSGYLIKPVRSADLRLEIDNLRHPLPLGATKRVRVQTFGNFEVFVDGKPLILPWAKCKECLAYLIDRRGACVTVPELVGILWENKDFNKTVQNNAHRVVSDLMKALKAAGVQNIIVKTRKYIAIDTEAVDCDYYAAIRGEVAQLNAFRGEYMSNYSWAELTLGTLSCPLE